jgi:hypothetical protein
MDPENITSELSSNIETPQVIENEMLATAKDYYSKFIDFAGPKYKKAVDYIGPKTRSFSRWSSKNWKYVAGGLFGIATLNTAWTILKRERYQEARHTNLETRAGKQFKKEWGLPFQEESAMDAGAAAMFAEHVFQEAGTHAAIHRARHSLFHDDDEEHSHKKHTIFRSSMSRKLEGVGEVLKEQQNKVGLSVKGLAGHISTRARIEYEAFQEFNKAKNEVQEVYQDPLGDKRKIRRRVRKSVLHDSELAGRITTIGINTAAFGFGTFEAWGEGLGTALRGGADTMNKVSFGANIAGAVVSAGTSIIAGKNYEEKFQGGALFIADAISDTAALYASRKIVDTVLGNEHAAASIVEFLLKEGLGTAGSIAITPILGYGLAKIGRMIDRATERKRTERQKEISNKPNLGVAPVPDIGGNESLTDVKSKTIRSSYKTTTELNLKDEKLSDRDVNEAFARKLLHGRAF